MKKRTAVALVAALGLVACHKSKPNAAKPSATAAAPMPPSAAVPGGSTAAPVPTASGSAAPAAVTVKKAKTEVNGTSISVADMSDIEAALTKAGWNYVGAGSVWLGATKTITVSAKKGALEAKVSLVRPTGAPETDSGTKIASASSQKADFAKKGATLLDGNALLAVVIKGKKNEAKKLLDALVKK